MSNSDPWTVGRLLNWTTEFLRGKGSDSPRLDAEVLLAAALGCERIALYTTFGEEPPEETRTAFRELVQRRAAGTPVAYLVGKREFFSLAFDVTPDVLIPRPETESLVVQAIDLGRTLALRPRAPFGSEPQGRRQGRGASSHIADVGTGSGIVAVCCAKHLPDCRVTAIDISPAALKMARANAAKHGVVERIEFIESDLFASCPGDAAFDLILSNPPYVSTSEMSKLEPEVRDHEPHLALDGGVEGMEVIQRLVPQAAERLVPGGWLLIEVSPMNAVRVEQLIESTAGLTRETTISDLAKCPRVVQARRQ